MVWAIWAGDGVGRMVVVVSVAAWVVVGFWGVGLGGLVAGVAGAPLFIPARVARNACIWSSILLSIDC